MIGDRIVLDAGVIETIVAELRRRLELALLKGQDVRATASTGLDIGFAIDDGSFAFTLYIARRPEH